tara:strand:- start:1336 stop:1842 length:507 start_codon:yes stop_codon:yes gene_type:complete
MTPSPTGFPLDESQLMARSVMDAGAATLAYADDLVTPAARQLQMGLLKAAGGVGTGNSLHGRMAGALLTPKALTALKLGTGLSAVGGVLGAADVIAGNDSLANKAMDTVAMGIGGTIGAVGGPMGIAAGAGVGKAISDGTQWLFGDKKTPEQRKLELALAQLQGGGMY